MPALDGLRGLAVVGVLAYHLGRLRGGYLGVDLFFVLSGFLITSLLLAEHSVSGRIGLRHFWERRARRLLPALFLLLLGVAAYAATLARRVDLPGIRGDALATLGYAANWRTILHGASYWDISLAPSPLQHTWSLAIEEQFYVLWPLAVVVLASWTMRTGRSLGQTVQRVAFVGAAASVLLLIVLRSAGVSETRLYEGTDTRAAALFLGIALAASRAHWRDRGIPDGEEAPGTSRRGASVSRGHALEVVGVGAALALGALWVALDGESGWLYRGGLAAASVLGTLVVAAASQPTSLILGRLLALPPLRWLGAISYGLYLWHWPVYLAVDLRNGRYPGLGNAELSGAALDGVKVGLSLSVAWVSFLCVEQPIRHGSIRRRVLPAATVGASALVAIAVVAATAGGIARPDLEARERRSATHVPHGPRLVVVGDSVGASLVSRVVADPGRYGVNPVDRTKVACSIFGLGHKTRDFAGHPLSRPSCQRYALRDLEKLHPDLVYLLAGTRPNDALRLDGRWRRACDPAYDAEFEAVELSFVRRLRASGAPVVIGTVLHSSAEALPVQGSEDRIDCVNRVIRSIARRLPGVEVLDANRLVCPESDGCKESLGGAPIRPDGLHFDQGAGGDRVADWVVANLLEVTGTEPGRIDRASAD